MKLIKCENGHYYDGDVFDSCPHCAGNGSESSDNPTQSSSAVQMRTDDVGVIATEPITILESKIPGTIKTDGDKTVRYYDLEGDIEPVVGWLVCIKGSEFGRSFYLKAGKNFIGRNQLVNDVVLEGDNSVSREKHAIVIYDPKSRKFLAQPGTSSGLFYVNDTVVLQAVEIKARDFIAIGNAKLMFIPFCGPEFTWDDYKSEGALEWTVR